MISPLDIVVLGLSLSSSWGNGHATTWRTLIKGLAQLGHKVLFLERDMAWYSANRDLIDPDFCTLELYSDLETLAARHGPAIRRADVVLVGSYVPEGVATLDLVLDSASGTVAFYDIDTPVTLAALQAGEPTYIEARQIPQLDVYLSFAGGPVLTCLETEYGARVALPLYCAADTEVYRPVATPPEFDLGYLGTYSPDRQPALERLLVEPARRLPAHRFVVGGSGYPDDIDWPRNLTRVEHVPPAEHPNFYASQRLTLNITRAAMRKAGWSPSVRLFEAAACGTPVVSDSWPGIDSFFTPDEAIFLANGADDVVRVLSAPHGDIRRVGRAARAIVVSKHTGLMRADRLARDLCRLRLASPSAVAEPHPNAYGAHT